MSFIAQQLAELENSLQKCRIKDRFYLARKIGQIRDRLKKSQNTDQMLNKLQRDFQSSVEYCQQRLSSLPNITYPEELPVSQKRDDIIQTINDHQVIIICGETGSGKTTQLPKMCLQAGLGISGLIGHTQPRRLAARAVATRIASELQTELGTSVGFKVRFSDHSNEHSLIKLMTDGILLSETHHDPLLSQYDCIIVDEAHERSLNIDFLLGYLKILCVKRPDLKIIITSATIDPGRFSRHFDNAPVIEVSGRTYPVQVEYRDTETEDNQAVDLPTAISRCVDEISRHDRGDILVFLSGERDIRETADFLSKQSYPNTEILPLLARLSASEQNRIFSSSSMRRIVLSTNVAETSLTVPGIKYVIDSGVARISRYSWRSKIQRLPVEKISQASANQRKGRCGRVSAGVCYRLYSEDDFNLRPEFTEPEIQRTNLAAVILTMQQLKLGNIDKFPFVEAPDPRLIKDGYKLLLELGAIDQRHKITPIGSQLARLPIDPKLGRTLIEASVENCLTEALIIISALAIQDPKERPLNKQQAADEAHRKFSDKQSDFMGWLNLWNAYTEEKKQLSNNQLRKWCKQNFISWLRMREWQDTHRQIHKMLCELKLNFNTTAADYAAIHRALLSGFISQIGFKQEGHEYQSCRQRKFLIFPGSDLFKNSPKWVVASDIVETQKVYARHLAKIEVEWISDKASHLIKHSYSNPHWQKKSEQVSATRKSTLFGLIINPGQRINYGPVNPLESRQVFIRDALVNGDFDCRHDFYRHNQQLIEEIQTLEAKSRRQDILIDEQQLYEFYDQHLPDNIYSGPLLNKWVKKNDTKDLFLTKDLLMQSEVNHISEIQFPNCLLINSIQFPLDYHFDPSHHCDGITLITPIAGLASLDAQYCDWLVPGLLHEKITELIRSLPKQLRKNFVPAPDFALACYEALEPGTSLLNAALSNHLKRLSGIDIPYDAWKLERLPEHLFFNYRVISNDGNILAESRDLTKLQKQFSNYTDTSHNSTEPLEIEQDNVDSQCLDRLDDFIEIENNGITLKAYPALQAKGREVNIRVYHSLHEAQKEHWNGLRQLFFNALAQPVRHLKSKLPGIQSLCIQYANIGSCDQLKSHIMIRLIDQLFTQHLPASHTDFISTLDSNRGHLDAELTKLTHQLSDILTLYHQIQKRLKNPPLHWLDALTDIQDQLNHLLPADFIISLKQQSFSQLHRYLQAIDKRLDKIQDNPDRDRKSRLEVANLWSDYKKRATLLENNNQHSDQLEEYRWLLEEYRISLFAQEIKTIAPVSAKRLRTAWNNISDA